MSDAHYPKQLDHSKGEPDIVQPQNEIEEVTVEIVDGDETDESFAPIWSG